MPRDDRPPAPPPSLRTRLDQRRARRVSARRAVEGAAVFAAAAFVLSFTSSVAARLVALFAFYLALVAIDAGQSRED